MLYRVEFKPGVYKYQRNTAPKPLGTTAPESWIVGREDTGEIAAFTFTENEAAHVCLALNLVHHYIHGNTGAQMDILRALEKFRH